MSWIVFDKEYFNVWKLNINNMKTLIIKLKKKFILNIKMVTHYSFKPYKVSSWSYIITNLVEHVFP